MRFWRKQEKRLDEGISCSRGVHFGEYWQVGKRKEPFCPKPHHPQVRGILVGHSPGAGYTRQIKKLNLYLRTMKSMDETVNAVWGLVSLPTATPTIQPTVKHGFAGDRVGIGR